MSNQTKKEFTQMYGGEVEMVYYPDSHQYRVNGKRLSSVSSIVGYSNSADGLINWAVGQVIGMMRSELEKTNAVEFHKEQVKMMVDEAQNEWERSRDKAANLGDYIHALLQGLPYEAEGGIPEEWQRAGERALKQFARWKERTGYESTDVERIVYSRKYNFAGRLDDIGHSKSGRHMLDYKTGSVRIKAYAQLAGYGLAWEEEFPEDPVKRMTIVDIDKETGAIEFHNVPIRRAKTIFRSFNNLHQQLKSFARDKKVKA